MMRLHNRVNGKELKEQMTCSKEPRTTISFYKYYHISDPASYRDGLYVSFNQLDVLGRIHVAHEGINAQISVSTTRLADFEKFIDNTPELKGIRLNMAIEDDGKSFFKLKILARKKILADGLNDKTFDVTKVGQHVSASEFNEIATRENTILIDMRNHYESEVGHFKGAICPDVSTFRDELPLVRKMLEYKEDKNVLLYCTGGIRCEKASAWLKHEGFKHVYQLNGGIIEYARQIKEQGLENRFVGKNFVFDERLGERVTEEIISNCHQCGKPCDTHTNCVNKSCHLLFIQCKDCAKKMEGCCSQNCTDIIHLPPEEQKALRKGKRAKQNVFSKGKSTHLSPVNQ